jgi:Ca-activated chloride channel family protein
MSPRKVANRDLVKEHINRIVPGNTTNLYDGLSLAAQQLMPQLRDGSITRMVVFSDGEPTAGIKDFGALVQHVGEIKQRGISCTFLGFGYEYNEELLAGLSKRSGGNYYFIARPELIPEVFRAELDKLMTMAARNLTLRIKTARWVALRQVYGHSVPFGQDDVEVQLADVEKGTEVGVVIDLDFQNHPLGTYRVAAGSLTYDDAVTGRREMAAMDMVIEFTADTTVAACAQNPVVSNHVEVALATRVMEKTMMGLKAGELTAAMAVSELQKTQMLLQQDGRIEEAAQVGQAIRDLQMGKTGAVEKTLIGTVTSLDQGKKQAPQ